ncbi:MAG TPA: DUF4412 domain-containing protein [Gemmatimonadaceae bacterium]|nr:DUF4412 domain-containing protein [Gemmatimonadaceae bacterium]
MRIITAAAALLAVATAAPVVPAQGKTFEGTITFEASGGGRNDSGSFAYSIKGSRVRFEPQNAGMPMHMIMDLEEKVMRMVVTGQNMYMEMPIPEVEEDAPVSKNAPVNTGRTDEVAGRTCEIWTMAEEGKEFEMCVARDMGTFMQGGGPMARGRRAAPAWQAELRKGGFFPLRVVDKSSPGKPVLVATKIEEKKLDDALFTVPAGMQKMSMPPGMGGRRP